MGIVVALVASLLTVAVAAPPAVADPPNAGAAAELGVAGSVLADGPLAYWPMTSTTGGEDVAGSRDGTFYGTSSVVQGPFGPGSTARHFDGGDCSGMRVNGSGLTPQVFTVEVWARWTTGEGVIYRNRTFGSDIHVDGAGNVTFSIYLPSATEVYVSAGSLADHQWHHLAAVRTPGGMEGWEDGILAQAAATSSSGVFTGGEIGFATDGFACNGFLKSFEGDLAGAAIFDRAIGGSGIRHHVCGAGTASGTVTSCEDRLAELNHRLGFDVRNTQMIGDPVEPGTGNLAEQDTDLPFSGNVYGLPLTRTYNSLDGGTGAFGAHWSSVVDVALLDVGSDGLLYRAADGRRELFPKLTSATWDVPSGFFGSVYVDGAGRPALRLATGETLNFDANGRLIEESDGLGQQLVIARDATTGTATTITTSNGGQAGYEMVGTQAEGSGSAVFYGFDVHRDVVPTDDNSAVPASYDPFGVPSATAQPTYFGYRAQVHLGLLVHTAFREYDPVTGTFTTPDRLDGVPGTTAEMNPYHYVDNDPVNLTDRTGLSPDDGAFDPCTDHSLGNQIHSAAGGFLDVVTLGHHQILTNLTGADPAYCRSNGGASLGAVLGVPFGCALDEILGAGPEDPEADAACLETIENGVDQAVEPEIEPTPEPQPAGSGAGARAGAIPPETPSSAARIPWNSYADYPKVTVNGREYAQVGDRLYTHHAVDRPQPSGLGAPAGATSAGRSISPNFVEDVIRTGSTRDVVVDGVTRTIYSSGSVQVVTEQGGRIVVTVLTHGP